jgi:hypothetical protein
LHARLLGAVQRRFLKARRHICVCCLDQVELVGSVSPRSETKNSREGSTMNDYHATMPLADDDVLVLTGDAGPTLGQIVVTKAALALLDMQGLKPQYLLHFHECTERLPLDQMVEAASHPEKGPSKPVLSRFETQYGPIVVMTELLRDVQNNVRTRLMLPDEL